MEQDILTRLKQGDKTALRLVFNLYHKSLYYFAEQVTNDRARSDDIVADAFIQLWNRNIDFNDLTEIKFFLFMVVRDSCTDHSEQLIENDGYDKQNPATSKYDEGYIDSKMIKAGILQTFLEEVEKLTPLRRKIFEMSYIDKLGIFEIAEKLHVTVDTVRVQKAKAMHSICSIMLKEKI